MERFGITFEDLKSGSVPPFSNIPNGLVLALFEVVKSKKELKIEELVAVIYGKFLNRASVISKV